MENSGVRLRVHFIPVGTEIQRVVEPLKVLHADVALLLTSGSTDRARYLLPKIEEKLKKSSILSEEINCNVLDPSEVVNEVGNIVTSAPRHEYFFNVSTGTRNAAIAGIMAGMFWQVIPYYVPVDDQMKGIDSEQDYPVNGPPSFIPTFDVPILEKPALRALEFIASKNRPCQKKEVLTYLSESGVIGPRLKTSVSPQALHGQLDSILDKLNIWGFIEQTNRGKKMSIGITRKGIEGMKMFFHMLKPKVPLDVLK